MSSPAPTFDRVASIAVEDIAAQIVENCLLADGSLFTPEREVWTRQKISPTESTPAADIASGLLWEDLEKLNWVSGQRPRL